MSTLDILAITWKWDWVAIVGSLLAPIAYTVAVRAQRKRASPRAIYLALAVLVFAVALTSPVGTLADDYLFSAHMLQHLLLVLVVPPLILLALPREEGATAAEGTRRRTRRLPPFASWSLGVGAMWLWHAPTLCNAAATSDLVHRVQEASLIVMGTAFWWPILAPRAMHRIAPLGGVLYLFTGCVACTILGIAVTFSPVEVCSVYLHPDDRLGILSTLRDGWGMTPERDQQLGGLLMWVPACAVYGVGILSLLARFYRAEDQSEHAVAGGRAS